MLLVLAGATSCGASKKVVATPPADMVEESIPLSGPQYRSDADYYRAVQNATSKERSMAQKIAMQNCRQELAANLQADLQQVLENYAKNQDISISVEYKSQYQELSYTIVNQQLRDVQVVEEKMFRQDDGLYRYYVCLQMPKDVIIEAVGDAMANDAKLSLEFDREQFKKVFDDMMAAHSQQ